MNAKVNKSLVEVLKRLTHDEDSTVAALSDALIPAASDPFLDSNSKESLDVRERISSLASQLASKGRSTSTIAEALLKIDKTLAGANPSVLPWATRLAPLAMECGINVEVELQRDDTELNLRESSPVFRLDDRTVMAVPVGNLARESLVRITDRIFSCVAKQRTKRVILVLNGLTDTPDCAECWSALREDLGTQKIKLELIE